MSSSLGAMGWRAASPAAKLRNRLTISDRPLRRLIVRLVARPSRLKVYKAVFEPKVTQDASELGVGVVFVS